jgi:hypothetical protein
MMTLLERGRLHENGIYDESIISERFGNNVMRSALQSETSRINGSKSKGPLTLESKAISSQNALRHGMTARKHALPHEDPQERAQRATAIANELNPQTELQHHLVGRINSAMDRQNRCDRAQHGKLTQQQRALRRRHKRKVAREVEKGIRLFHKGCPIEALLVLRRSAEGCRWLRTHWVTLRDRLARYGIMAEADINALLHLDGTFAAAGQSATYTITPQASETVYLAVGTWPTKAPFGQSWLRELPAAIIEQYKVQWPTPQAHREELLRRIDAGMAELDARIAALEADDEAELEDESLDALTITDTKEADLHLRYAKEADTALDKALKTFWSLQEREATAAAATADAAEDAAEPVAPEESPPPEAPTQAPADEAVAAALGALPEECHQEVRETIETLVELTEGLAPEEAWDFAQQSLGTLRPGVLREALLAVAEARFRKEPGARVDVSVNDGQQKDYVATSGYHAALLAGLREMERCRPAMRPGESPADPPLER